MTRYEQLQAEQAEKRKKLNARKIGVDNLATLKDEREDVPTSIRARIDADIAKGREAEKVKQIKIQQEREAQDKYTSKYVPSTNVLDVMKSKVDSAMGVDSTKMVPNKTPHVSDINRSAANVDYSREAVAAKEQFIRENPTIGMTPLEKATYNAQKYNPLAVSDMAVNRAGAGVAQSAAALGDAVLAPFKGGRVTYPTSQTPAKADKAELNKHVDNAINALHNANKRYYLGSNTLQDKADRYTAQLDERYARLTDTFVTRALSDLAQSTGYMVPATVTNAIMPGAGTALLFASGYASGERQAVKEGASSADAKMYALLNGLNQSAGELLIGGVLGKGAGALDGLFRKAGIDIAAKITNPKLRTLATGLTSVLGEGAEEIVQSGIDTLVKRATYDPNAKFDLGEAAYEGLIAGLMGIGGNAIETAINARNEIPLQLPSDKQNAAQTQKTGVQANPAQDFYNSRIADIKSRETDLFGRLRTAEEDEIFNRLTTAKNNTEKSGILAGASDETIAAASRTATAGSVDILFERMERTAAGNIIDGYEYGGKLYINPESKRSVEFIQGHEFTHAIEKAKSYDKLSKYVLQRMGAEAVAAERQRIGGIRTAEGQQLTEAEIDREIVADFAGENLLNNEADIVDIVRADRTLAEKIRDWLSDMIKRFTGTAEEKFYARARSLYIKALSELRQGDTVKGNTDAVMASVSEDKVYYRGTTKGDTRHISTGNSAWDDNLFVSKDKTLAEAYGANIEIIRPKPNANIVTEGTPQFNKLGVKWRKNENMLGWGTRVLEAAKSAGYDIIEFSRQGDVGTVVINPDSVLRNQSEPIKSATSNIGTYDAKNPDIRYSISKADDESYMTAVNNGDTDTAQKMVDEAAKKAGYNVKAYHGSKNTFTVFSETLRGTNQTTEAGKRYFFAGDRETAESYSPYHVLKNLAETMPNMFQMKDAEKAKGRGGVLDLYIAMKNPLEADLVDYNWSEHSDKRDALMEYIEQAEKNGNDGLIFHHVPDNLMNPGKRISTIYLFRNSSQAKSADPVTYDDSGNVIPLSQRFNPDNPDIRYSVSKDDTAAKSNTRKVTNASPDAIAAKEARRAIKDLESQNAKLREVNEYQRKQFKRSERKEANPKAVAKYVKRLLRSYTSKTSFDNIAKKLADLYIYIANGDESGSPGWETAYEQARDIANDIIEGSEVLINGDALETFSKIKNYFKGKKFYVPADKKADFGDYQEFRRKNFGHFTLTTDPASGAKGVDIYYGELTELFGEGYFPSEITNPADQLQHISHVMDGMNAIYGNPFSGQAFDEVTAIVASDMLDKFYDIPQADPTFADKAAKELTLAKVKGQAKLDALRERKDAQIEKVRQDLRESAAKKLADLRQKNDDKIAKLKADIRERAAKARKTIRQLEAANSKLRELNEYQRAQFEVTTEIKPDAKAVTQYIRSLRKRYASKIPAKTVTDKMAGLFAYNEAEDRVFDWDQAYGIATDLARSIIDSASVPVTVHDETIAFLAHEILDKSYVLPDAPPTFADRAAAALSKERERSEARISDIRAESKRKLDKQKHLVKQAEVQSAWEQGAESRVYAVQTYVKQLIAEYKSHAAPLEIVKRIKKILSFPENGDRAELLSLARDVAEKVLSSREPDAGTIADNAADKIAEEIADRFYSASRISKQQVVRIIKEMEKSDRLTQYIGRGRESRSNTSLRNRIRKGCQRMVKMLAKPDKNRHIPDELQQNVAELFDMIASSPDKIVQTGDMAGTPKTDALKDRLAKISDLYRRMLAENNAPVTLDPDMQAMFDQAKDDLANTPWYKLDAKQLENLYKLTRAIYKSITTANKSFRDAQNRTYDDLAEAVRVDNAGKKERTPFAGNALIRGAKKVTDDLINFSVIDPRRFFKRLGKTMETLYLNIERGQDKYIETVTKTVEFMIKTLDGIDTTKWDGDGADRIKVGIITDEFAGTTKEVEFTPAMLMDLYLANKREQSRKHLYGIGGIALQPPGTDKPTKPLKINEQQINDILSKHMTPEMTRVANAMSEYLTKEMGALANEVSQEMYEYSKFTETNYWPIDVHRGSVAKSFGEVKGDPTLENSGATKTLVEKAKNALVIKSALDVFDKHSIWAAAYNAYVPALADMRHVLNVKDADGTTIASLLNDKFGERTEKYINNFMNLVNSGKLSHGLWNDKISKKLLRNFKAASVGMNLSVVIKQPVSYIRAADVINPKYLIKALKLESRKTRRANMAEMLKYNPIARIKDWGFADMGFGKNQRQLYDKSAMSLSDKISEASGFLPSQADKVTWARIWAAVKLEQQAKGVMDVARWAERFREVISSTQVVNTIFTTPPILNEDSTLTSMATAFMAEPLKSFNMLHDAVSSQNAAQIRRTAATLITNTFAIAIIDTAFKHLRQKKDEEETTLLSLSGEVLLNMVEDAFSMLPYARDVISILQGYNVDRADLTGIDKLWKALSSTGNDIAATVTGGEPRGTVLSHLKDVVAGVSVVTGIPAGNIWRDIESVLRSFAQNANNAGMEYLITATLYNPENESNRRYYYDMLYKYRNDDKVYEALKNRLIGEHGYKAENIEDAILSRWKKSGEYKSAYESEAARVMPGVEGNPRILELPKAEREEMAKQADTYAAAVARDRLDSDYELNASAKKIKSAVEDGLSVGEYLLYTNARKKADEALDDNGSYSVKEKVRAIRDLSWLNVSKQQALLILDTRTKDNPEGLANEIEAILGSGLSFDEFLNVYERHNEIYNEEDLSTSAQALKYANWLDGRYTAEQSDTIQEYFDYWSGAKAVPTNYNKFTDAGMDIDTAYDLADSISKLEPMEGQKAVSTLQRYRVIADAEISDKDKLRAMSVLMSETAYKELAKAKLKGLKIESYVKYLEGTAGIVSDVKNGETVYGSRKQKVLTLIDRMILTKAQKDLLYDIAGYAAGTIDDAPWHGGERYDGDIHQRKVNGRQLRPLS